MPLLLGDIVPDFTADTTLGPISFHDWIGDDWAFFFSHPADFTPVCTTEMGRTSQLSAEFDKRGVKPIGLSTDTVDEHLKWTISVRSIKLASAPLVVPGLKKWKLRSNTVQT